MMKKLVIALILVTIFCSGVCARMPQVGDQVSIDVGFNSPLEGTITDIDNGLICLHQVGPYGEMDICIGIGSIMMLKWKE